MKKLFLCLFLVGSLATTFTSCREEKSTGSFQRAVETHLSKDVIGQWKDQTEENANEQKGRVRVRRNREYSTRCYFTSFNVWDLL